MEGEAFSLATFIIEEAVKNEPAIAADIQEMFGKGVPTTADWETLRGKWGKSYRDYVPGSDLPPGEGK